MDTSKTLVIFFVEPFFLLFKSVNIGLCFYFFVVLLEKVGDDFVVVVVGTHMQHCTIFSIDNFVNDRHQTFEQLFGLLLVKTLNSFEQLFLVDLCHIYTVVGSASIINQKS